MKTAKQPRYWADLNPEYGARGQGRWAVFTRDSKDRTVRLNSRSSLTAAEKTAACYNRDREAALAKLTPRERQLLGFKED